MIGDVRRIIRHEVPVDDQWHKIVTGPIVSVGSRNPAIVEFWAWDEDWRTREFRVYGTGHPISAPYAQHRGSVIVADGALVWHLLELTDKTGS